MADVDIQQAIVVALQGTEGTYDTTLAALGTPVAISDGLIYGDPRAGLRGTGIDLATSPRMQERQNVIGSRTRQDGGLLAHMLDTLTVTIPMCGSRVDVGAGTPVAADFNLGTDYPGMDAMLRACGMTGGDVAATYAYTPTGSQFLSAKIWESGTATGIRDARAVLTLSYRSMEVPTAQFAFKGIIHDAETSNSEGFPASIDYETHLTIAAPGVEALTPTWAGSTRHFTDLQVVIDPGIVNADDARGTRFKYGKTGTVTVSGTMVVVAAQLDVERDAMLATGVAAADLILQVGTTATADDDALAHKLTCTNMRVQSVQVVDVAESGCRGIQFSAVCTATTDGGEFTLTFL